VKAKSEQPATNPYEDPMAQKTAEAGDNSKAQEERKALHFHHVRKIMAIEDQIAELRVDLKAASKTAQADGIERGDLDFTIKAISAEDKAKISDRYVRHGEILEWLGMIPSFEPDMFRDRMPAVERREKQGELAGLANKPRESGFAKGSDDDHSWLRGYDRGQETFKENIVSALEKAEEGRQKGKTELIKARGRPKKPTSAAGQPIEGETPDEAKAAEKAEAKQETVAAAAKPPKPPKQKPTEQSEDEMTNAEKEALRQARQMFVQ
jgi:hypothetical protein